MFKTSILYNIATGSQVIITRRFGLIHVLQLYNIAIGSKVITVHYYNKPYLLYNIAIESQIKIQTKEKLPTSGSEEDVAEQRSPTGCTLIIILDFLGITVIISNT